MFDLSRVGEFVGGLLDQNAANASGGGLLEQLSESGFDLAQLDGLAGPEVLELLEQSGIDIAGLDPAQISELTGQLSEGVDLQSITDLIGAHLQLIYRITWFTKQNMGLNNFIID